MILQDMETSAASDSELLAAWVAHRRESAFGSLVARYATLVHMAAKRTCGDDSLAADASQLVFIQLAQKAQSLTTHPTLAGWLHVTAVMKTRDLIDKAQRESRKRSHFSAAMETRTHSQTTDAWLEIQPVLDDALAALSDKDREALLLRFYRSLSIREIAETLGIATAAAQKRIDRATERLRGKLTRRGCQVGGSLSAALLAGFAADAQAAALPVSLLASKAIAAGAVSSFSLTAIITSIATLMKSTASIPPLIALLVAGVWTGTKYQSLSAMEARNGVLLEKIAAARSPMSAIPVKLTKDDGPIDWQKLAAEEGDGPETRRFKDRLKSMTREEMITALDRIAGLDCSKDRRSSLESSVAGSLMQVDPEWVLNHFAEWLRDDSDQQRLQLVGAFGIWAGRDLGKATAWFDRQIAAGAFDGKALDQRRGSSTRYSFEAVLSLRRTAYWGDASK
ncbi:MAG: RNA polymerase sigma factor [Verrucomicrobia bacterium]|nr:RNA polymerase sigma factor [Verrucomicrobiota bacterium]